MALIDQLQALPAQWEIMLRERFAPLREEMHHLFTRAKNPVKSSFLLGCDLMDKGLFEEAKLRFKFVLWRRPAYATAWYNLAVCHFSVAERYKGLEALNKALALDPKDEMALYLKATYEEGQYAENYAPHTTPLPIVRSLFGDNKRHYDMDELIHRKYRAHEEIAEELIKLPTSPEIILDAGCGTGLCGSVLSTFTDRLIGLDVSAAMLAEAKAHPLKPYHKLIHADLRDHLLQCKEPTYDAIVSANVMPIVGGLAPVMDGAVKALTTGGYFIFTTYALEAMEGYRFITEMKRFAHSSHYLKTQAERAGLKPISLREISLYEDDDRPSYLVVLQK